MSTLFLTPDTLQTLPREQKRQIMSQMGVLSDQKPAAIFYGRKDEKGRLSDFDSKSIIYFKNCSKSSYRIESRSLKIFVENCHDCTFEFNGAITTGFLELWRSSSCVVKFGKSVQSMQVDLSKNIAFVFPEHHHKAAFDFLVWAGCEEMTLQFGSTPLLHDGSTTTTTLQFGLDQLGDRSSVDPEVGQFKVSVVEGELRSEEIRRMEGGYLTTDRESLSHQEKTRALKKKAPAPVPLKLVSPSPSPSPSLLGSRAPVVPLSLAGFAFKPDEKSYVDENLIAGMFAGWKFD